MHAFIILWLLCLLVLFPLVCLQNICKSWIWKEGALGVCKICGERERKCYHFEYINCFRNEQGEEESVKLGLFHSESIHPIIEDTALFIEHFQCHNVVETPIESYTPYV